MDAAFRMWKSGVEVLDVVPKEWFTSKTLAKHHKVSEREAQRIIRDLLDMGKIEAKKFRVKTGSRIYKVLHYKTCKPTKKTP